MRIQPIADETITQYLQRDHQRIDRMLADLGAMIDDAEMERAEHAFPDAKSALRRHIRVEEELLFPAFEGATGMRGPVRVMCVEHRHIEGWLEELEKSLAQAQRPTAASALAELLVLLHQHNLKEERVLYPRSDEALSSQERQDLLRRITGGLPAPNDRCG